MDGLENIKNKFKINIDNIFQAKSFSQAEFFRLTVWLVQESKGQIELLEYWIKCVYQERDWKVPLMPMGLLLEQIHRYYGKQFRIDNQLWNLFFDIQKERLGTSGEKFRQGCLKNLDVTQPAYQELATQFNTKYHVYAEAQGLESTHKSSVKVKIGIGIGVGIAIICIALAVAFFALKNKNSQEQGQELKAKETMEVSEAAASDTLTTIPSSENETNTTELPTSIEQASENETNQNRTSENETIPENLQYTINDKLEEGYNFESFAKEEWWICKTASYVRQGCDDTYTYFKELQEGDKVIVLGITEEGDGWARVYYENRSSNIAYVKLADIQKLE